MSRVVDIRQLDSLLSYTPIVFEGEPLLLAELNDLTVERDVRQYVQRMDDLSPMPAERTVFLGPVTSYFDRWPVVVTENRIPNDIERFNDSLFQNYDLVRRFAFCQSHIADWIEEDLDVDVIVLLLIDGLSYADWANYSGVESCLVEGPTITPVGFRNIIGKPTIAHRLFKKGFQKRWGFSHWDRDNKLTDVFFHGFDPAMQMFKVDEFKEILLKLDKLPSEQVYIQILTNGLDAVSHRHRGRPPVESIARHLYENMLLALAEHLQKTGVTALVYATADHGIMWKPEPGSEEKQILIQDNRATSHRYAKGAYLIPNSRQFSCYGTNYTVLAGPYLFRSLTSLEWGTHGGISFQESVVPFVKLEVI